MDENLLKALETQRDEFFAVEALAKALKTLPAIVDDDYPEYRHYYESAMRRLLQACKANGRTM